MEKRILVVDDDADVLAGLAALLGHAGWKVMTATTGREALRAVDGGMPDVVLLDVMLPDLSGLEILEQIKRHSEATVVVVMSGVGTIDMAVEAMRGGAETFIAKPCDYDSLELVLEQAARNIALRQELEALRRTSRRPDTIFAGISPAAQSVNELVDRVADAPSPVLIEGESGCGKGVLARILHNRSSRARAPFVDLNCAGLSKELVESELFGHERGAFTDASSVKPGLFELAGEGTVFLDEIGELEPAVQSRLLKALEEKRFRRVGGVRDIRVNFRLIAATNRDLDAAVASGEFRRDLFFRLNVVRVRVPSLRERSEDVPILAHAILDRLSGELGLPRHDLSERALARLCSYSWPGNVRELRNALERAMLMARDRKVRVEDLLLDGGAVPPSGSGFFPENEAAIRPLDEVVNEYIERAIAAAGGNARAAARRLEISPSTLYARLRQAKESAER